MKKIFIILFLITLLSGCIFDKKIWLYVSFEYSNLEGGWFSGYIESSDGKSIKDVIITIDSSYSFTYIDTLRKFLNDYVFPDNQFDVSFEADGYEAVYCSVKIPKGINLEQFDGVLSLSDDNGDTISWTFLGEAPDAYRVLIYKGFEKIYDRYLNTNSIIIYSDIFTFAGVYTFYLLSLNYSELNNAAKGSIVAGVYRIERNYTITNK